MKRKPWQISRRKFLGGAGAMLALPWLEAMAPTSKAWAQGTPTKRLLAYYVPNGIHMPNWTPSTAGTGWELTPILEPLGDLQSKVNILTGLRNDPARPDGPGDHAAGTGSFITAAHCYKTEGSDIRNGISMDQVAANAIGEQTAFPSLQLGIDGGASAGGCDSGYSCAYARNISWASETQPLPKTVNPQLVFDRLFAGFDNLETAAERDRRTRYRRSVLDYVLGDANALRARLGRTDQRKVDEYLDGVRALELRIQASLEQPLCEVPERPLGGGDLIERVDVMHDLMTLAFQCDQTRVISFMFANAGSGRNYGFIGASGGHHEISHHQSMQDNFDKLTIIDRFEVEQFSLFLQKLDAVAEGERTLLDNSLIFFSSEISDGNRHNHDNMPVILAGGAGGGIETGRHLVYEEHEKVSELFISMLNNVGVEAATFGDGDRPLPRLA